MRLEQIREVLGTRPFQPFVMYLADGRTLRVDHPEFMLIGREGRRVVVESPEDRLEYVDPLMVTGISVDRGNRDSGKGES